ncbi:MAG: hypothetical protein JWR38_2351 [Mucilaginibacter sp.]|nr:hypothetical protein [Mucilaginibacter sp.]
MLNGYFGLRNPNCLVLYDVYNDEDLPRHLRRLANCRPSSALP